MFENCQKDAVRYYKKVSRLTRLSGDNIYLIQVAWIANSIYNLKVVHITLL